MGMACSPLPRVLRLQWKLESKALLLASSQAAGHWGSCGSHCRRHVVSTGARAALCGGRSHVYRFRPLYGSIKPLRDIALGNFGEQDLSVMLDLHCRQIFFCPTL